MNMRHLKIGFAALAIAISAGAFADDIYKWTDADGNLHYGDRPSGQPSEERLKVTYNRTNAEALENRVQDQSDAENSRQEARAEAAEDKRAAEEDRRAAEQQKAQCESSRAKLRTLQAARRVYRTDEAGEQVYLNDIQRAESLAKAESSVREACDT